VKGKNSFLKEKLPSKTGIFFLYEKKLGKTLIFQRNSYIVGTDGIVRVEYVRLMRAEAGGKI